MAKDVVRLKWDRYEGEVLGAKGVYVQTAKWKAT
jgi:hypothetical protein